MDLLSWMVLADAAFAVSFVAFAGSLIAGRTLWRMRRDWRVMEAAERFEPVDLTTVVKRYVPPEQQTQRFAEEIGVARQVISARRPRWRRMAAACGVLLACGVVAAAYAMQRHMQVIALEQRGAKPKLNLDVLKDVQGVWGWQADALQSCEEDPQTITVTPDRRRVSVSYAKPHQDGIYLISAMEFDVVSARSDALVLSGPVAATPDKPETTTVYIQFINADTFTLSRSDQPMSSSGSIVRCPSSPSTHESVAH